MLKALFGTRHASPRSRNFRELVCVVAFSAVLSLLFINKAFHLDEPPFLAMARQITVAPLHPMDFEFNMFDRSVPMSELNEHPLVLPYLLAGLIYLTGEVEWVLRLLCLPFDLMAAVGLYLLARRYLRSPLLPTLILLAGPAYLINMNHLMAEKWMGAFGFLGLYALSRGLEEKQERWYWGSALLLGAAVLFKPSALFLAGPACVLNWSGRRSSLRIAAYLAAVVLPWGLYSAAAFLMDWGSLAPIGRHLVQSSAEPWSGWPHRLRAFAAFTGACGVVLSVWPYFLCRDRSQFLSRAAASLGAAALLFAPVFDWEAVTLFDRLLGIFCAAGAILALWMLLSRESLRVRGRPLWISWIVSVAVLQLGFYWSIVSRFNLFLLPPFVFACAALLESRWKPPRLTRFYGLSLAGVLALSLPLAMVDARYAGAQKELAGKVAQRYIARGTTVWFTGHWGLQYYLERAGAKGLDRSKGGWDAVRPGEIVVVPMVNSSIIHPSRALHVNMEEITVQHRLPLRLIHLYGRQAGFYSSIWGFLPFTWSSDPVDRFRIVELLGS